MQSDASHPPARRPRSSDIMLAIEGVADGIGIVSDWPRGDLHEAERAGMRGGRRLQNGREARSDLCDKPGIADISRVSPSLAAGGLRQGSAKVERRKEYTGGGVGKGSSVLSSQRGSV